MISTDDTCRIGPGVCVCVCVFSSRQKRQESTKDIQPGVEDDIFAIHFPLYGCFLNGGTPKTPQNGHF